MDPSVACLIHWQVLMDVRSMFKPKQNIALRYGVDPAHLTAGPKWWTSDEYRLPEWVFLRKTSVPRRNVQQAFRTLSRRLFTTETVVLELQVSHSTFA